MRTIPLIMNDISKYIKKYKAKYQWETNTAKIIKDDKVFILNYLVVIMSIIMFFWTIILKFQKI